MKGSFLAMKRGKWLMIATMAGFALLATAFAGLLEVHDRAEAAVELSCLASIGVALEVMPSGEFTRFSDSGAQWRVLGEGERTWLLENAAKAGSLDCRSRRREGLFAYRYSEPEIAVRGEGSEAGFRLRVQAEPRFYQIGGRGKVLRREVKIRLEQR